MLLRDEGGLTQAYVVPCCAQEAIALLELALERSKHNFQLRMLLVRLWLHPDISAFEPALAQWKAREIKQIMVDTIGHLLLR
jgi:hypothetical protein